MKNLPYNRAERVADRLFQVVSEALFNEISDPRLKGVSITRAKMTKDLRVARVFFHMDKGTPENQVLVLKGFESSKGFLKRHIAEEIQFKFMPEIEFYYDESIDVADRIDELLRR